MSYIGQKQLKYSEGVLSPLLCRPLHNANLFMKKIRIQEVNRGVLCCIT